METEHEFILTVDGIPDLSCEVVDALFDAGCDDATIMMRGGKVSMGFTRSAPTMKEAILSAIADVRKAGIGAQVIEAVPDRASEESAREVSGVNSVLQAALVIERDPTLRPFAMTLLDHAR
jgi:hypothetical protein